MTKPANSHKPDYSIVIPVYYNEGCLVATFAALKQEVLDKNPQYSCEIIFVDDGSGDGSLQELLQIRRENPNVVKVIKLSRNFGQIYAVLAGFAHAKGRCAVMMSADGQDPAGLIHEMLKARFGEGFEIVVGTRRSREESGYRILTSRIFYYLMKKLAFPNMPKGGFDFVLLSERAKNILLKNAAPSMFLQGQILWLGLPTKFMEYERRKREVGVSRWTFARKLTMLIDGIMAYSFFPIRLISALGVLFASLGFFYALVVFFSRLLLGNPVQGWAPLMIVVLVLGGFQMLMLGVIGEYLWRTLAQVRNKDLYVIDAVYDDQTEGGNTT